MHANHPEIAKRWEKDYKKGGRVKANKGGYIGPSIKGKSNKMPGTALRGYGRAYLKNGGAAWTRKEGKSESGGLNERGRKSYEAANPGSDLKAPQPEGGPRKRSFCARMRGMKKRRTSAKTANDPDSRINKALRKWKC